MSFRIAASFVMLVATFQAGRAQDLVQGRDLVIGSGDDAVRLRVRLMVDGQSIAELRDGVRTSIIEQANQDGDDQLSPEEWRAALMMVGAGPAQSAPSNAESAAKRSVKDALEALDSLLGPPIEFEEQPRPLVDRLELFEGLDLDGDQVLTRGEFAQAPELMDWYDADGDGTLDMPELAPTEPLQPVPMRSAKKLPQGDYPFAWEPAEGTADVLVETHLVGRAFGRPKISARLVGDSEEIPQQVRITPGNRSVDVAVGDLTFVFEARLKLLTPFDVKRFFLLQMRVRDNDKNGYLDEGEFLGLGIPNMSFEMADSNQDEKLYTDELAGKLDGLIVRETNRIRIKIGYEREALFTRLDQDEDSRLSRRELLAADQAAFTGGPARLALEDFGGRYRLQFGVPSLLDDASPAMVANAAAMAQARIDPAAPGPAWFKAMDRNRDGDLSRREFFGDGQRFAKLDADKNGLLALEEIEGRAEGAPRAPVEATIAIDAARED